MTALLTLASFAAGLCLGLALWSLDQRRQIAAERRRWGELTELRKHQALPAEAPAATGSTIRLDQVDVIRPLPPVLALEPGDVLVIYRRRHRRPMNNN